jgi:hypothetical protein
MADYFVPAKAGLVCWWASLTGEVGRGPGLYLPLSPKSCPSLFFFPAKTINKTMPMRTMKNIIGNMVILY